MQHESRLTVTFLVSLLLVTAGAGFAVVSAAAWSQGAGWVALAIGSAGVLSVALAMAQQKGRCS